MNSKHRQKECTVEEIRNRIGPAADEYTDAQIRQIQWELETLAGIIVDTFIEAPHLLKYIIDVDDTQEDVTMKSASCSDNHPKQEK